MQIKLTTNPKKPLHTSRETTLDLLVFFQVCAKAMISIEANQIFCVRVSGAFWTDNISLCGAVQRQREDSQR